MTMTRQNLLEEIRTDIEADLNKWAEEAGILNPDEHIEFSITIVRTEVVVEVGNNPHQITIQEFFSEDRLMAAGCSRPGAATLIRKSIQDSCNHEGVDWLVYSMTDFINACPRMTFSAMGSTGKKVIRQLFAKWGLVVPQQFRR